MIRDATLLGALAALPALVFVFAFGACVGSFVNVLIHRLPRGMGVVRPASRCPACQTRLTWRENIPIFGWLLLRGRCRFCRTRISPQYPLIEALMALLFAALYLLWFADPWLLWRLGVEASAVRPAWTQAGAVWMWPTLLINFALIAGLVAMTVIDARTFTIPLIIPWVVGGVALLAHPLHALVVQLRAGSLAALAPEADQWRWTIPTPSWDWTAAALAGAGGLIVAVALLEMRLLPRSFADYEQWEREALARQQAERGQDEADASAAPPSKAPRGASAMLRALVVSAPTVAGMFLGFSVGLPAGRAPLATAVGAATGLLVGLLLRRLLPGDGADDDSPLWTRYPHARREVVKELAFLAPPTLAAVAGLLIARAIASPESAPPLWLAAGAGSLLGMLAGGAVVWIVRIVGTLAFGKEAMGLGDAHLLAAVGACLGWIDPLLAFFIAPFFGLLWALGGLALAPIFRRQGTALPYGPHLALATLLLIFARPLFERALTLLTGAAIHLP